MFTLAHDYLVRSNTKERILITDDMINALGREYEEHFYYQYLGFKRL
jgi:hypothetical protein